jgi:hypothetical protein
MRTSGRPATYLAGVEAAAAPCPRNGLANRPKKGPEDAFDCASADLVRNLDPNAKQRPTLLG